MAENNGNDKITLKPSLFVIIAASFGFLILLYSLFLGDTVIRTPKGQHLAHTLPDGSQVWLNADTEIRYKDFARESERNVELKGEAFFRIVNGGNFSLNGDYGTVTVLGTSFNVNQRKDLKVACFRGTVLVSNTKGHSVKLKPGQASLARDTLLTFRKFNAAREASWLTGDFYFHNAPLEEVLEEVQRQFNIEILYNNEVARTYTGYFNIKDMDNALRTIFGSLSMHYRKEESQIIVEEKEQIGNDK